MVDQVVTKQELIDAQKDAQSLDDFINGGDEQIVVTRLLKEYPTLANAIRQIYEKGGKFYPALAAANADIANIRTDVYVITGDNGAYYKAAAGATSLTKSPYDPIEQAKNYVDSLNPLSKAIVLSSGTNFNTITNEGFYRVPTDALAASMVNSPSLKSGYLSILPVNVSGGIFIQNYIDSDLNSFTRRFTANSPSKWLSFTSAADVDWLSKRINPILKTSNVADCLTIPAILTGGDIAESTSIVNDLNGRVSIFKVKPNTNYTIKKDVSARFRVAVFNDNPLNSLRMTGKFLYFSNIGLAKLTGNKDFTIVTTESETKYIAVYTTNIAESSFVECIEGAMTNSSIEYNYQFSTPQIKKTANLFDGKYILGRYISGSVGDIAPMASGLDSEAFSAVIKVKPNTSYVISKTPSNRFRVGISNDNPLTSTVRIIAAKDTDNVTEETITTDATTNYLVVYVANAAASLPSFMQIEEGTTRTSWAAYGYKFIDARSQLFWKPPVGDALYTDSLGNWYSDRAKTVVATDDTVELKKMFDTGIILLEPNRSYITSETLLIDVKKIKVFIGNGALIIGKGDIDIIKVQGSLIGNSSPQQSGWLAHSEKGVNLFGLRVMGAKFGEGTCLVIEGTFSLKVTHSDFFLAKKGIEVRGQNRDLSINNNDIWANRDVGIHYNGVNQHQGSICLNIITYSKKTLWFQNSEVLNVQINSNTLETNTLIYAGQTIFPEHIILVEVNTGKYFGFVHIEGNNMEDHGTLIGSAMCKLVTTGGTINQVGIVGGELSGAPDPSYGIELNSTAGGVITNISATGVAISGYYAMNVVGDAGTVMMVGCKHPYGRIFRADGNYNVDKIVIKDAVALVKAGNPIHINLVKVKSITISNNDLDAFSYTDVGNIGIYAVRTNAEYGIVRVTDNNILQESTDLNIPIVKVRGNIKKTMVMDNISTANTPVYTVETTGVAVNDNNI